MKTIEENKRWNDYVYRERRGAIVNCRWETGVFQCTQKMEYEDPSAQFESLKQNYEMEKNAAEEGFDNVPMVSVFSSVAYLLATAYGCPVHIQNDLTVARPLYADADAIERDFSFIPRAYERGLYRTVFERIDLFQERYPHIPIGVSDTQSPIDILTELMPMEEAILLLYDNPTMAHTILSALTDSIIEVNRHFEHKIANFAGFKSARYLPYGIHVSDDNAAFLSPSVYREFALPYVERLSDEFGGIQFHVCMKYEQNLASLAGAKGCIGLDAMPYYNDPYKIVEAMGGRQVWNLYDESFTRPGDQKESAESFYKRMIDINENRNAIKFDISEPDREPALRLADTVKNYAARKGMAVR